MESYLLSCQQLNSRWAVGTEGLYKFNDQTEEVKREEDLISLVIISKYSVILPYLYRIIDDNIIVDVGTLSYLEIIVNH